MPFILLVKPLSEGQYTAGLLAATGLLSAQWRTGTPAAARMDSIHPWTWRAPTSPGKRTNTAFLAQLGAKSAKAQLSKDLAHQDHDTTFTCPGARGASQQDAPSTACLLHHGEHLPAFELMVVLLQRWHDKATTGSRSETHPLSN